MLKTNKNRNKAARGEISVNRSQVNLHACPKSTSEQYAQIFRAISSNYFENSAIEDLYYKQSTLKNIALGEYYTDKVDADANVERNKAKYGQDDFNQAKQINKFFKIFQVVEFEEQKKKQKELQEKGCNSKNRLSHSKMLKRTDSYKEWQNRQKTQMQSSKNLWLTRPTTGKRYRKKNVTEQTKRQACNIISMKTRKNKGSIVHLKKSIEQLEQIAVQKYGMPQFSSCKRNNCFQNLDTTNDMLDQLQMKLKQIKTSCHQQQEVQKQNIDSSIPTNYMKFLFPSKKLPYRASTNMKQRSTHTYFRI